ncbi:capsular polysaccharide biosynthesis protein [Secundilactobacillus oryzae JCM 18671]|uniref:Capsular polysaccharide biosynthesis protein CpsC n=1 Tax=Secundilactobacillus oryzae JCM 18671 TaxID=1291743 RepID=A0A081BI98_9LACO|nr:Wzz/FepE/Etk N-terminal domain-containing protein [Secundilactobacillus oryzae]GAK47766.1 capsular polysaccharide biosynthesis protein [Secundilactobacillus oryzae JCM 18671]
MNTESAGVISFGEILLTLRKHIMLILGTTVVVTLVAAIVTVFFMTPKYTSGTQILVNRKMSAEMAGAQLQANQADIQMINTYKDIITSPVVRSSVEKQSNNLPGATDSEVSVATQTNSQVFTINVTSTDPFTSAFVANKTAQVFKKRIVKMMSINNVTIVSKAKANKQPVSPKTKLNLLAGLVLGLILGIGLAFLSEFNDKTVKDEKFLTETLGLNSLGIINEIEQKEINRLIQRKSGGIERSSTHRRRV